MLVWPRSAEHGDMVLISMAVGRSFAPAAGEKPWTNGILSYPSFPSLKNPKPLVSSAGSCQRSWIYHPTLPVGITSAGSWRSEQERLQAVPFPSHPTVNSCFLSECRPQIIIWEEQQTQDADNVYVVFGPWAGTPRRTGSVVSEKRRACEQVKLEPTKCLLLELWAWIQKIARESGFAASRISQTVNAGYDFVVLGTHCMTWSLPLVTGYKYQDCHRLLCSQYHGHS